MINPITKTATLGFYNNIGKYTFYAKQGDTERKFSFTIDDDGKEYEISNDTIVKIKVLKPDGHVIEDVKCISIVDNIVTISATSQMLMAAGLAKCELIFSSAGVDEDGNPVTKILSSYNFNIEIGSSIDVSSIVESTDEFDELTDLLIQASGFASHLINTSNPHGTTSDQLGLGNVENKSSATIRSEITSSNVTTALGFTPEVDGAYENATAYTDQKIADLINGAPETLNTLKEIADAMAEDEAVVDALNTAIGTKANQSELDTHTGNDVIHVTSSDKTKWNGYDATTFITEPATFTNITSGTSLATIFGNLKSWFTKITALNTKVGTATLTTTAQDLSGAVNSLNDSLTGISITKNTTNANGTSFSSVAGRGYTIQVYLYLTISQTLNANTEYTIAQCNGFKPIAPFLKYVLLSNGKQAVISYKEDGSIALRPFETIASGVSVLDEVTIVKAII